MVKVLDLYKGDIDLPAALPVFRIFNAPQKKIDLISSVHAVVVYWISVRGENSSLVPVSEGERGNAQNFRGIFYSEICDFHE